MNFYDADNEAKQERFKATLETEAEAQSEKARNERITRDSLVAAQVLAEQVRTRVIRARNRLEGARDKRTAQRIADQLVGVMNDLNDLLDRIIPLDEHFPPSANDGSAIAAPGPDGTWT